MTKIFIPVAILIFASTTCSLAVTGTLHGTITDSVSGKGIGNAKIEVVSIYNPLEKDTTYTDPAGYYRFDSIDLGDRNYYRRATVSKEGYASKSQIVPFYLDTAVIDFKLAAQAVVIHSRRQAAPPVERGIYSFRLYNLSGVLIRDFGFTPPKTLAAETLPGGVYMLKASAAGKIQHSGENDEFTHERGIPCVKFQ